MRLVAARTGKALLFVGLGVVPLILHVALFERSPSGLSIALSALPLLMMSYVALTCFTSRYKWPAVGALWTAMICVVLWFPRQDLVAASWLPHAFIYITLLTVFGTSLLPNRKPLVTALADRIRGPLTDDLKAYTRGVTWAWCGFFAAQLVLSLILLAFAPRMVWSMFVNMLNFPLVALMFAIEYAFRPARFRDGSSDKFSNLLFVFGQLKRTVDKHVA